MISRLSTQVPLLKPQLALTYNKSLYTTFVVYLMTIDGQLQSFKERPGTLFPKCFTKICQFFLTSKSLINFFFRFFLFIESSDFKASGTSFPKCFTKVCWFFLISKSLINFFFRFSLFRRVLWFQGSKIRSSYQISMTSP